MRTTRSGSFFFQVVGAAWNLPRSTETIVRTRENRGHRRQQRGQQNRPRSVRSCGGRLSCAVVPCL